MNVETVTGFITSNKGQDVSVSLTDHTVVTGTAVSVNSKGINLKVDGKIRSFGLGRIDHLFVPGSETDTVEMPEDLHDGMTTAELAAVFGIEAKELRVHLRSLGLGVGKGRKYSLAESDYRAVKALVNKS